MDFRIMLFSLLNKVGIWELLQIVWNHLSMLKWIGLVSILETAFFLTCFCLQRGLSFFFTLCPGYNTNLHPVVRLKLWRYGVPLHCHYSQLHSELE